MVTTEQITLIINAQDNLSKTLDNVVKDIKSVEKQAKTTSKDVSNSFSNMSNAFNNFKNIIVGAAIVNEFKKMIDSAADQERATNALKSAVDIAGGSWAKLGIKLQEYSKELQETTQFSDEEAMDVMQRLITLTGSTEQGWKGAGLALDMAATGMVGLEQASRMIAMAMSGNITMLSKFIPELRGLDTAMTNNMTSAQKAAFGMQVLQDKFGGRAAEEVNTYSGRLRQMQKAYDELGEAIGTKFLGALTDIAIKSKEVFVWMSQAIDTTAQIDNMSKLKDASNDWWKNLKKQAIDVANSIVETEKNTTGIMEKDTQERLRQLWVKEKDILEKITGLKIQNVEDVKVILAKLTGENKKQLDIQYDDIKGMSDKSDETRAAALIKKSAEYQAALEKDRSYQTMSLAYQEMTDEQKAASDLAYWTAKVENAKAKGLIIDAQEAKRVEAQTKVNALKVKDSKDTDAEILKSQKKMTDDFVKSFKGGYDYVGAITDKFSSEIATSLAGAFGGVGDSLSGIGLSAGSIFGAIGGTVLSGFMSLFGNQKSQAQLTEEAFKRLSENANKAIDSIGKEKSIAQKKIDILGGAKVDAKGNIVESRLATELGVTGMSKVDAQRKLLDDLLLTQRKELELKDKSIPTMEAEIKAQEELRKQAISDMLSAKDPREQMAAERKVQLADAEIAARQKAIKEFDVVSKLDVIGAIAETEKQIADLGGGQIEKFSTVATITDDIAKVEADRLKKAEEAKKIEEDAKKAALEAEQKAADDMKKAFEAELEVRRHGIAMAEEAYDTEEEQAATLKAIMDKYGSILSDSQLNRLAEDYKDLTTPDAVIVPVSSSGISAPSVGSMPHFADGGVVTRPTVGLIGEAGAEAIIPLNQMGSMGGVTIEAGAFVINGVNFANEGQKRAVAKEMASYIFDYQENSTRSNSRRKF